MTLVLLADDDILMLNRLRTIIDWNANGYEIIGQSLNGTDTIRQVEQFQPDILILDVNMPDKNGVEVAKTIQNRNYQTSILILSNYDNFEFVRDTLRFGAYDYLLKHQIESSMLLQKLNEIKEKKINEGLRSSHIYYFASVAKQHYLKDLVLFGVNNSTEQEHMQTLKDCSSKCNVLVVMQVTNFIILTHFSPSANREKLIDSIINLATNIFVSIDNGIIAHLDHGEFVVLFHYEDEISSQKILETTNSYIRLLLSNMQKLLNITALYQISNIVNDISYLNEIYNKTVALLNHQPFNKKDEFPVPSANSIDIMEEKNLMDSLMSMNIFRTELLLKQIFTHYSDSKEEIQLSQQIVFQLLQIGLKFQQGQRVSVANNSNKELLNKFQQQINNTNTYQFICDYYKNIITDALNQSISNYSQHIQNAILYIREYYASEISLVTVADKIHVSSAHLSRLFKKETGTSFVDYLTSFRIELAQQMIKETNSELKEISDQVGFNSYNYFLRVYKEKTGHTPSQEWQEY